MKIIREITGNTVRNPEDVYKYLREFKDEDREYFIVIGLDTRNKPVYREIVSIGTLDSSLVHPREVFKKAILMSCRSIIIAHNHPSGDPTPSAEDILTNKMLHECGDILQIKVLDHIIIGGETFISI